MPFTLSHVVAILPVRRWLPPSALVVGAVVPDAPYYLPLPFSSASLVWDAFTQVGGFAVVHWQALRQPVVGAHRVFNVLMYVSSAGGLVVLGGWLLRWYRRAPIRSGRRAEMAGRVRGAVLAAAVLASAVGATAGATSDRAAVSDYDLVRSTILGAVDGVAVVLACYVLVWHGWTALSRRRASREAATDPSAG